MIKLFIHGRTLTSFFIKMTVRFIDDKGFAYTCSLQKFCENTEYFKIEENCERDQINISLLDIQERYDITESLVKMIADYIETSDVPTISNSNAVPILALCNHLHIPHLEGLVKLYIDNHSYEIIDEFLYKEPKECPLIYERLISQNLLDHIDNPALLNFSIPCLHRIFSKFAKDGTDLCTEEIVDFLCRGLDKFGRDFSFFIQFVPAVIIPHKEKYFLEKMLEEYKDIFDPVYLHPSHIKYLWTESKRVPK